mgnify:CR=1 FL=1|tara:strand:- start:1716 stop:2405 length:690 start_codon:yes stop_codon:yes gene_type:complete
MKVLILGDGLLGSEIKKQTDWDLISRKTHTFDFNQITSVYKFLKDYDVILNCIANTDTYSKNKEDHWNVNYKAVSRLTDWCNENHKKFVHISTDFVYANNTNAPSEEEVPVHAQNWYSYTKLLADGYIELKGNDYLLIRTSFKPTPFPYDTAFTDVISNCDYVNKNASRIIDLINQKHSGIYNVGGNEKSIYELAKETHPDVKGGLSKGWMPKDVRMNCNKFNNANKKD